MSREWYFARGKIIDVSGAPLAFPDAHPDSGDYILLMNPTKQEAEIEITFFFEDRDPVKQQTRLAAERVAQHPLHVKAKDILPWNVEYGCRVVSSVPLICQRTNGQWLPNDDVTECMGSTIMHPGPLGKRETRWAYADGIICRKEGHKLEESEWVGILNPNRQDAHVTITAYHAGDRLPTKWGVTIPAERIRLIKLDDQEWVVPYELFGLMIESDLPIVVEQLRHAYEQGKYLCPRSMFDTMAYAGFGID